MKRALTKAATAAGSENEDRRITHSGFFVIDQVNVESEELRLATKTTSKKASEKKSKAEVKPLAKKSPAKKAAKTSGATKASAGKKTALKSTKAPVKTTGKSKALAKVSKAAPQKALKTPPAKGKDAKPNKARAAQDLVARKLALTIADAALDKKADQVEIIDVRGKVDYADFVVVMGAKSDRQLQALARGIEDATLKAKLDRCLGVEGLPNSSWVLMDYGDVVVHIFHGDVRGYYDLGSFWIDAERVPLPA